MIMRTRIPSYLITSIGVLLLSLLSCSSSQEEPINQDSVSQTTNPLLVTGEHCFGYQWEKGQKETYDVYTEEILVFGLPDTVPQLRKRYEQFDIECVDVLSDSLFVLEIRYSKANTESVKGQDTTKLSFHPILNAVTKITISSTGLRYKQEISPRNPIEHPSGPYANLFPPVLHRECAIGGENWVSIDSNQRIDEIAFPPTMINSKTLVEFNELAGEDSTVVVLTYHKSGQASEGIIDGFTKERTTAVVSEQAEVALDGGIVLDAEISSDLRITTVGNEPKEKTWRHLIKSRYRKR